MARVLAVALTLVAAGAGPAQEAGGRRPLVVCSTTQVADFARQVAGDRCDVRQILEAGEDPHTYATTPGDAELVARADLCLENGLMLEGGDWMKTLARTAGKPIVTCTDGVTPLQLADQHGETSGDPHVWFSPLNAARYVNNITAALVRVDAAGAAEYKARAELYLAQLRALHLWIDKQIARIPPERRVLVTSHDAFHYFCDLYGLKNVAPQGWSTGDEVGAGVTPERREQVVRSIRDAGVPAIFVETSVNPQLVRQIADEAGVTIGGELYSDAMGPPGSAGETYIGMMRENVLRIVAALAPPQP